MSEVLNDRDAVLQAAAVRVINPKNASILLTAVPAMFHLDAAGVPDATEVVITARLLGLLGDVTFTAEGATLTSVTGSSAVVRLVDMQGPTAIVRAHMTAGGEPFVGTCIVGTLRDGQSGGTAKVIVLTPSQHVFKIDKTGANSPGSITLTAAGQNLGGVPSFTIPVGTATLTIGANALQKVLTFANMTSDIVTVQVAQDGVSDRVTIVKLREGVDGADAIIGLLSNESVTLPASSAGVVSSYSGAVCTMSVFKGAADDSAAWSYAFSPASAAARLTYTASGSSVTITGMPAGVDSSYVDITASKAGAAPITKRFWVAKSRAGVTGARGAGRYYAAGTAWTDGAADAATPGDNVVGDVVQISSGTFVMEKRWTGDSWVDNGVVVDGRLIVTGSILTSALAANAVTADKLAAGAITSRSILVSSDIDNLVRDARFKDLPWWGFVAGDNVSPADWDIGQPGIDTGWKYAASMYMGVSGGIKESITDWMGVVPGATYMVEYQIGFTADFVGEISVEWHLPSTSWYGYGIPGTPGLTWPDGGPVHYTANSPKDRRTVRQTLTLPDFTRLTRSQIRIRRHIRAGNCEIGGFTITRVVDNVLIKDGAITAGKLNVGTISAISSNIGLMRTAVSGQRMEIDSNSIRSYGPNNQLIFRAGVW